MKLKCFFCNKLVVAPYHITEIQADKIESYDMCEECGSEFIKDAYAPAKNADEPVKKLKSEKVDLTKIKNPKELLSFIMSMIIPPKPVPIKHTKPKKPTKPNCQCGMSVAELEEYGKFGCPQCYNHFAEYLECYGAEEHVGKRPKQPKPQIVIEELSLEDQLKLLKLRLAKAIEVENYEQAAEINAQIKKLPELHAPSSDQ